MIDLKEARKHADPDCEICEGEGAIQDGPEDERECECVKIRKREDKGERQFEDEREG